jgi:chromatin remodeling complex protein RSC6
MSSTTPAVKRTTKKVAAPAATAAPVAAVAPTPVVAKVVAPTPTPTPAAAAPATTTATTTAVVEDVNIVAQFNTLVEQVNTLRSTLGSVFSNMKKLEKQIPRELKKAQKGRRRRAAPTTTETGEPIVKKESVFTKPTPISDALCTFLGVAKGSSLSRSEVTTKVCAYAKSHLLMDKQVIKADAPLRKLLALTEKDELKILNLQRYLKPHYLKPATPTVAATKA